MPTEFGPWQTKRHHRFATDGTWDRVLTEVVADADAGGEVDWTVSADSSVMQVHQHPASASASASQPGWRTGGAPERQDSAGRRR